MESLQTGTLAEDQGAPAEAVAVDPEIEPEIELLDEAHTLDDVPSAARSRAGR